MTEAFGAQPLGTTGDEIDVTQLKQILPRYVGAGPRYTSYPTVPHWTDEIGPAEHLAALADRGASNFSVYTHIPFCKSLCHFCACNRIITRDEDLPSRYLDAIEIELETTRQAASTGGQCDQLHWGGGTPTHLRPEQIERLFRVTTDAFSLAPGAEVSIEVDPRVTTPAHVAALAECGFNRISMGVQDTNAKTQAAIHRIQPFAETRGLTELARERGIEKVNFDLIYGLPHQTKESFSKTIDEVLSVRPDRIALYGYAHVTWVAKQQRGFERIDLPDPTTRVEIMCVAIQKLLEAGYRAVGMDHFALPDDELCTALDAGTLRRNFMGYTTRDGLDVLAFGPSGISDLGMLYAQSKKDLDRWFERVEAGELATERGYRLSQDDVERRAIISSIMCLGRFDPAEFEAQFGHPFDGGSIAEDGQTGRGLEKSERLQRFREDGLIEFTPKGGLVATSMGRLLLRHVAMTFDAYLAGETDPSTSTKPAPRYSQTV